MSTILIVDDEPLICNTLAEIMQDQQYSVATCLDGVAALDELRIRLIDVVLLDVRLPKIGGMQLLETIMRDYPGIKVIVISGHGNIETAVQAMKLGAFDFLEKPIGMERVVTVVAHALQVRQLERANQALRSDTQPDSEIIGNSKAMQQICQIVEQSAESDTRILITGENGTGKEIVARKIHRLSTRRIEPFVAINCAAIPDTLIESELFGHEKGAFTGAVEMRRGKFELATGGTLFLDEVADMSPIAQSKVLRAIQEMRIERVGGNRQLITDARIVAATNRNLSEEIEQGRFRADLYFRLNVIPIHIPPLRERPDDIAPLVSYFLKQTARSTEWQLSEEALDILKRYRWPGNVRELKNFIERVTILSDSNILDANTVRTYLEILPKKDDNAASAYAGLELEAARIAFERDFITHVLSEQSGNVTNVAKKLGVYPGTLYARMKKIGIRLGK